MKKTTLFAGAALSILLPATAAAQQTRDRGPTARQ